MANRHPFIEPKQERATNIGTALEKLPISFSANVWERARRDRKGVMRTYFV